METEKIISELKTRAEINGDGMDRTIADYVNLNLPAEGTEPDDAYFTKHVGILKSISGNFNHAVATQVNEFKKNFKPEPKPEVKPEPNPNPTNGFEERLKAIEEAQNAKYESLKKELEEKDKALQHKSYINQVESKFKADLESKSLIYDPIYFEHIISVSGNLDTTKSVDETVKDISEKYDKMFKDRNRNITANGFVLEYSESSNTGAGKMTAAEAMKERYRQQGDLPNKKE